MDKLNVGEAMAVGDNLLLNLNITKLKEYLELPEVQMALRTFRNAAGEPQESIKLFIGKLQPAFASKFQTHSVRIDTTFRNKE